MSTLRKLLPFVLIAVIGVRTFTDGPAGSRPVQAQSTATPYDCSFVYHFTGSTASPAQLNNSSSRPCVAWRVTYTTTGFSSVTVQFEVSPDTTPADFVAVPNTACSASVQPPCFTDGASPITPGVQGTAAYRAYGKYVRVNVTSVSSTGTGDIVVYGYKGTSASAGTGGGGGTGPTGPAGPGYLATSTTSLTTAGSGSKTFTTQAGLAYTTGARVRATSRGTGEFMEGLTTSYSGTSLIVTMDLNSGTGTHADWDINLAGNPGVNGAAGPGFLIVPNDGSTGTTTNLLATINASGNAILATTTDTAIPVYVCQSGCGTTGSATLVEIGSTTCQADAAGVTTAHFIVNSTATNGRCQDGGATAPTSGWVAGIAQSTAAANATFTLIATSGYNASSSLGVQSPIEATFTGGGTALTAGTTPGVSLSYIPPLPFACTAVAWTVTVDAGTAGFRVWRIAAGTAVPTVANTITTSDLAISSGTNLRSTTFTNFSGSVAPLFAANDIVAIQLNAAATATVASFSIQCQ